MGKFDYAAKQLIQAAQWDQSNYEDMKDLLRGVVECNDFDGIEVYTEYIEPYFLSYRGETHSQAGYYILKFYAGDDMEVDPGMWVVVYEDGEVEIMEDQQFNRMFEKRN
jgi:hypothetical protein